MLSKENSLKISAVGLMSAILVVFIHIPKADGCNVAAFIGQFIGCGVCYMAVPFFFLVAGYMLSRHTKESGWWLTAVRARCKTIIMPYLIWCIIAYLVHVTVSLPMVLLANYSHHAPYSRNLGLVFLSFSSVFGLNPMHAPSCVPLWFLRSLFLFVVISPAFAVVMRWKALAFATLGMLFAMQASVGAVLTEASQWHDFFYFFMSFQGAFYFAVGFFIEKHRPCCVGRTTAWFLLPFSVAIVALKTLSAISCIALSQWLVSIMNELAIVLLLVSVWTLWPKNGGAYLHYSFPIYVLHPVVIGLFAPIGHLVPALKQSLIHYFVFGLLVVAISVGVASFMRRRSPQFASIAFGGR